MGEREQQTPPRVLNVRPVGPGQPEVVGAWPGSVVTAFSGVTDPFYRHGHCSRGIREVQRAAQVTQLSWSRAQQRFHSRSDGSKAPAHSESSFCLKRSCFYRKSVSPSVPIPASSSASVVSLFVSLFSKELNPGPSWALAWEVGPRGEEAHQPSSCQESSVCGRDGSWQIAALTLLGDKSMK